MAKWVNQQAWTDETKPPRSKGGPFALEPPYRMDVA